MVASKDGRGALIVFEGVDRSGKSTQSKKLVQRLQSDGVKAELWCFPDRKTATGKMIDSYLQSKTELDDAAIHLLFSANRWEKRKLILEKLHHGTTLVIDRYSFSGAVFTAAKKVPGLDLGWCKAPECGLPAPDQVLFLNLDIETAAKRGGFGNERYEKKDMQLEVQRLYKSLSQDVPGWLELNAAQTADELHEQIHEVAHQQIQRCATGEKTVPGLWANDNLA